MEETSTASATGALADTAALRRNHRAAGTPGGGFSDEHGTGGTGMPTVGQRRARRRAQTVRTRRPDPVAAANRVETYLPTDPAAAKHMCLVRCLVLRAAPVDGPDATELLVAVAHLAAWLDRAGLAVTEQTVTDPRVVDRWSLHGLAGMTAGSSANYRSRLNRVLAAAHGPVRAAARMARSDGCDPYTPAEEDLLRHWAVAQRTDRLRDNLLAVLGLGLGAGLSAAEALAATAGDVTVDTDGTVLIAVGGTRPRTVPVLDRWADDVLLAAHGHPAGRFLVCPAAPVRGKNLVSNLIAGALKDGGTPTAATGADALRPVGIRMRATFLLRHLQQGTRADRLLAISGLDGLGALDRYLPALKAQDLL